MKTKTKYVAKNGREFNTKAECLEHEALLERIDEAFIGCPRRPEDPNCRFANGGGYLQWTAKQRKRCETALRRLMKPLVPSDWDATTCNLGWLCRCADDSGSPLYGALLRLYQQDAELREWGQPYYAQHPSEGKQIEYKENGQ